MELKPIDTDEKAIQFIQAYCDETWNDQKVRRIAFGSMEGLYSVYRKRDGLSISGSLEKLFRWIVEKNC